MAKINILVKQQLSLDWLCPSSPLHRGLVPFQVRSLVQTSEEARVASMVKPGEHWKVTVWL